MLLISSRTLSLERASIGAALVGLTLLAWGYLSLHGAHGAMSLPGSGNEDVMLLMLSTLMWSVMMVAMMLPSAFPMIFTFTKVQQRQASAGRMTAPTWLFVAGYLCVWVGFSMVAAITQWSLHEYALLSSTMGKVGPLLGGGILITAGLFQFSKLKQACLRMCRTPLGFLMAEWRDGLGGALVMGSRHGLYCTGCCWALMLVMFVGGVMNLALMAALAVYFVAEKLLPRAQQFSQLTGALLVGLGMLAILGQASDLPTFE